MAEKEYIELKRRIVYRGDAYQAINDELIKVSAYAISSEYMRGVEDGMKRTLGVLAHRVKDIPAADVVEVRHGKWVWDENGMDWGLGAWTCSECHRKPETWWEADKGNPYRCAGSRYCNNCGAKMDGGAQ